MGNKLFNKLVNLVNCTIEGEKYERLVTEFDVSDASKICPTCRSTAVRKVVCTIQEKDPLVQYLHCTECKGNSVSKMPTVEYLISYYNNYYSGSDKQVTFPGKIERFARHINKYLKIDSTRSSLRIMDYGGGDGSLAVALGKILLSKYPNLNKIQVLLVDYQPQKDYDTDTIEFRRVEILDDVIGQVDILIASAILEHIPDLHTDMKKMFPLVAPGGYFYARVPYLMPFKKIFKGLPMLYPMHVNDLGPSYWNRIIKRYKLNAKIVASHPPLAETEFSSSFIHTLVGYLFKIPAYLDIAIRNPKDLIWNYVAGWEYIIRMDDK